MGNVSEFIAFKAKDIIEREYIKRIKVKELAKRMGITPNYLSEIYHWHVGETIKETINKKEIELAKGLLQNTKLKVNQIAKTMNMEPHYFSRMFKKKIGCLPNDYRKRIKKEEKNEG